MVANSSVDIPQFEPSLLDRQLLSTGSFSPLHWLLDSGLLAFSAYQQWRNGEQASLDGLILVDDATLLAALEQAENHARKLDLQAEPQHFYPWQGEHASQALPLSSNAKLAEQLGRRWQRRADRIQFDLFMDNCVVVAENRLCEALATHQWQQAEEAYQQLAAQSPNHTELSSYEGLIAYGRHIDAVPAIVPEDLHNELLGLEQEVLPLAQELLRQQARDFLAAAWRRLALGLSAQAYDPQQPRLHASHAWGQLPDWQQVIDSILATPKWSEDFQLMQQMARAHAFSRQAELSLLFYCALVEIHAQQAASCFDHERNHPRLQQLWQAFNELNEVLPVSLFPAYVFIREPGLTQHLTHTQAPRFKHSAVAATLHLLQQHRRGKDEIEQRKTLQASSPTLLKVYLSTLI